MVGSWLARLVSAEVRRLTAERDDARETRKAALKAALRWHRSAQLWQTVATAATAPKRHVGRCGQSLDSWSRASPLICALPAGHAGWHRDDNRAEWGPINNPKETHE